MSETRSILIAEVAGDGPLFGKIGAMETNRAVERCRNRAERSIESNDGTLLKTEGRQIVAQFQRCENAVLAAFDMRTRVSQLPPVSGVSLSVRIALHIAAPDAGGHVPAAALDLTKMIVKNTPTDQVLVTTEVVAALPDSLQPHLDRESAPVVAGYDLPLYQFKQGTAATPLREAFSPTATSIALHSVLSDGAEHPAAPAPVSSASPKASLMLRHENHNFTVSDLRPVLLAGREDGNDLVIADKRASRHHSRVEWRQNRFVLIDTSTNGTYLVDEAGNEVILRRSEADMPARGRIGFGYSPLETGAEVVFFDIGQR
ncbi:FHA domain-containing protein [Uliginosibacterium gangwonense]|uniref:FHA domain-containing protein n=1 Tax=Uliginosibacterium gangwonense TaxID=392736 RepID=UPI0003795E47|nr:FHA domain-containing protein [Uliginosibacterium gangwonense]